MRPFVLPAAWLAMLAACGSPDTAAAPPATSRSTLPAPAVPASVGVSAVAAQAPGGARSVEVANDLYAFAYAYPEAAGKIPGIRHALDTELEKSRAELTSESNNDEAAARKDGYPYRAHESRTTWKVVTSLPDWLSLSAQVYVFSGGAHGMTAFDTLVWDKRAGARLAPIDLFTSKDAFRTVTRAPFLRRARPRAGKAARAAGRCRLRRL